jgi:hypothetical protein
MLKLADRQKINDIQVAWGNGFGRLQVEFCGRV